MDAMRAYRWGSWFFGIVSIVGLAALPFALSCCAAFSRAEFFRRRSPAEFLLDWPMDFRVFLLALVAALVCTAAMIAMALVARSEARAGDSGRAWAIAIRAALSSLVVGVLYLPTVFALGFLGVPGGPHNLAWMLGIPMIVAWMGWPRRTALLWGVPLALGGWLCLGLISMSVGIPLD